MSPLCICDLRVPWHIHGLGCVTAYRMMVWLKDKQWSIESLSLIIGCKALNERWAGFMDQGILCQLCESHGIALFCLSLAQIPQECAPLAPVSVLLWLCGCLCTRVWWCAHINGSGNPDHLDALPANLGRTKYKWNKGKRHWKEGQGVKIQLNKVNLWCCPPMRWEGWRHQPFHIALIMIR